ncbi:MAG TPA: tail fiber domain-containing protein [Chloroflexi bacterium]|nr:tail fiber domain-containing protein [Chloroflexota bacterium]
MTAATTTTETTLIETLLARIEELERTLTERIATLEMALVDKDALLQTLALEVKGGAVIDGALRSASLQTQRMQAETIVEGDILLNDKYVAKRPPMPIMSLNPRLAAELDTGTMSEHLFGQLRGRLNLTPDARIEIEAAGSQWLIVDKASRFRIKNEGRDLKVYDLSVTTSPATATTIAERLNVEGGIGGKLVSLDTSEHLFAYVRAHDLFLGHSQRGKKRNAADQGRALVDNGANLVVNFGPDWAGTVIGSNTQVNGDLGVAGSLSIAGKINGQLSGLDVAPTHSARVRCSDFLIGGSGDRGPERRALVAWPDLLEVNHNFDWKQCRVNGFTAGSSRDLKDNIAVLDAEKAKETLLSLQPTEFSTIGNEHRRFFGFIAEETPDTVASDDHKGIYLDGILSVLTRVVQAQQREIESLKAQMALASGV